MVSRLVATVKSLHHKMFVVVSLLLLLRMVNIDDVCGQVWWHMHRPRHPLRFAPACDRSTITKKWTALPPSSSFLSCGCHASCHNQRPCSKTQNIHYPLLNVRDKKVMVCLGCYIFLIRLDYPSDGSVRTFPTSLSLYCFWLI